MTKSEIWQVTATLTIPSEKAPEIPKLIAGSVAQKLQELLEEMRNDFERAWGWEMEIGVCSQKTGELTQ